MASSVVVDIMDDVVKTILGVRFDHGHPSEMFNTLNNMSSGTLKTTKFPLVMMFEPFSESTDHKAFERKVDLTFILAVKTESSIRSKDRYDLNFRTKLIPMVDNLKAAIVASKQILTPYAEQWKFETQIHSEWGTQNKWGTSAIITNDYIDCIEVNTTLQFREQLRTLKTITP